MKTVILIASILLMTGCSITNSALTPETNQLFDQNEWQPVNTNSKIKEEIFYEK